MDSIRIDTGCFCCRYQLIDLLLIQQGFILKLPGQSESFVFVSAKIVKTAKFPSFDLAAQMLRMTFPYILFISLVAFA